MHRLCIVLLSVSLLAGCFPSDRFSTVLLAANFNADDFTPGPRAAPNRNLPGPPDGDFLEIVGVRGSLWQTGERGLAFCACNLLGGRNEEGPKQVNFKSIPTSDKARLITASWIGRPSIPNPEQAVRVDLSIVGEGFSRNVGFSLRDGALWRGEFLSEQSRAFDVPASRDHDISWSIDLISGEVSFRIFGEQFSESFQESLTPATVDEIPDELQVTLVLFYEDFEILSGLYSINNINILGTTGS